jgi:hypothetical protein
MSNKSNYSAEFLDRQRLRYPEEGKMNRVRAWLTNQQIAGLKALGHRTGRNFSETVREATAEYLKKCEEQND